VAKAPLLTANPAYLTDEYLRMAHRQLVLFIRENPIGEESDLARRDWREVRDEIGRRALKGGEERR
jgi:hypothetical protein